MRFRGHLTAASFPILMEVSQFMQRVSSSDMCFVVLNEERMSFAMKTSGEDVQTFVHLNIAKVFGDVVIESRADNNIAFALGIANFSRALQSGKEASGIMLRLLKRDGRSFLSLRARTVDLDIIQNIPIEVVSMATAESYREPNIPPPTVALEMPPLRALRTITDRLKAMQKFLLVQAGMDGTLRLRVQSDTIVLQTLHTNLRCRPDLADDPTSKDGEEADGYNVDETNNFAASSVRVDARHASKMLSVDGNAVLTVLCCLVDQQALVVHAVLVDGFGSFTCYVPVVAMH
ncbi:hypothetical protein H310_01976 [Aphanomyces invadans]|uniref:Checkpoint protein n=1 Tax=Aphanomyces invadans TaxID=157072 RepID=A0A024UMF7_9STRA|nr:hypothetical protein H310_01976 [Aphanomyces invadans]ETW07464.1 hypothetical protein H310_01976 [Aphanomyces invadans]|eukprot:XP_008863557.1 hypothetical protein H310_01976 [Aphanomyces invadans]